MQLWKIREGEPTLHICVAFLLNPKLDMVILLGNQFIVNIRPAITSCFFPKKKL